MATTYEKTVMLSNSALREKHRKSFKTLYDM